MLSLGKLCDDSYNILLNKQKMYAKEDKEVVIEGEQHHRNGRWDIIIPAHHNDKTSVHTNNYATIAYHARLYAASTKYKRQQILSMTVQRPAYTQQLPTSYIQEFGAMNVLIYDNQDNNNIKQ